MLKNRGFTLIELTIIIAVVLILSALVIPVTLDFYNSQILEKEVSSLENNLKTIQTWAMSEKDDSAWGIKFEPEDKECEGCYVLFQGNSYQNRNAAYDEVFVLPSSMQTEGIGEIIFQKSSGKPIIIND